MSAKRLHAYILLFSVSAMWGVAAPIIKFTQQGIAPIPFLTYRFFLAGAIGFLLLIPFLKHHAKKIRRHFGGIFLYSFLATTLSLGLLFLGLEKTTVLDTVLITAVTPLVSAFMGYIILKERITHQEKLGITIAFLGTLVTVLEPLLRNGAESAQLTGNLLVVGYLFVSAFSAIIAKKLSRSGVTGFNLSNMSFIIGFLTILPVSLYLAPMSETIKTVATLDTSYHLGVFYMAFVSGTIAYAFFIRGQQSIEVSEAGVFAYLTPLFSTPLAVLWLGETLTLPFIIGAIFITIGVIIAETKKDKRQSNK